MYQEPQYNMQYYLHKECRPDKEAQADTIYLTNQGKWQKWYQTEEFCQPTDRKNINIHC